MKLHQFRDNPPSKETSYRVKLLDCLDNETKLLSEGLKKLALREKKKFSVTNKF